MARVLSIEESSERKELQSGRVPEACKGSPIGVLLSTGQEIIGAGGLGKEPTKRILGDSAWSITGLRIVAVSTSQTLLSCA